MTMLFRASLTSTTLRKFSSTILAESGGGVGLHRRGS